MQLHPTRHSCLSLTLPPPCSAYSLTLPLPAHAPRLGLRPILSQPFDTNAKRVSMSIKNCELVSPSHWKVILYIFLHIHFFLGNHLKHRSVMKIIYSFNETCVIKNTVKWKRKNTSFMCQILTQLSSLKPFVAGTSILRRSYTPNFSGFEETLVPLYKRQVSGVRITNPTELFSTLS